MLKKMKLGTKLQTIFLIVSIMGSIVAGMGIYNMNLMNERTELIYKRELVGLSYIKDANVNLIYIGRARSNYMLAQNDAERESFKKLIDQSASQLKSDIEKAKSLFISKEAKDLFSQYETMYPTYLSDVTKLVQLTQAEPIHQYNNDIQSLILSSRDKSSSLDHLLVSLSKLKEERAKDEFNETNEMFHNSRLLMVIIVAFSTFLGIIFGILMTKSVTRKLGGEPDYAVDIAKKISQGDLTVQIQIHPKDTTSLLYAIKNMQEKLSNIVKEVKTGAISIELASNEIAAGNMELSSRTEEQAGALEETASSMEEITSTVQCNLDNTNEASSLAKSVAQSANTSSQEVKDVLSTMSIIQDSAKEMVEIISVVEGIAFQTNILALNAAVEAARAGEQGRGFAVVAGEVRILAQRSSKAANEIKLLINKSVNQIELGANQANMAGTSMEGIVEKVQKVSDLIKDISNAGKEQTAGIGQINDAIIQIDNVTQQNAALVEEAAAASQSLKEQATNLTNVISIFKVEEASIAIKKKIDIVPVAKKQIANLPVKKPVIKKAIKPEVKITPSVKKPIRPIVKPKVESISKKSVQISPSKFGQSKVDLSEWEEF